MALSITRSGWDLGFKPLLDGAARSSGKHHKDRKEASSSSKKKDSKRSSQQKSKAKAKKPEDHAPAHPKKPPFSCNCADRAWNFDKTGHPFCWTCNQKSTSIHVVGPKTSDSTISTVAESKEENPGASNESLRTISSESTFSGGASQKVAKLKNQNTIQAILGFAALEQQHAGFSSSDTSTRSTPRKKGTPFGPVVVTSSQSDVNRHPQDQSVNFGSRLSQRFSQSIKDACHYGTPAETTPSPGFGICPSNDAHVRPTTTFEGYANTQSSPKPIMKSRSRAGSACKLTPPRRVSFEESSTSEAIMTPDTGSPTMLSGDESDFESSSSDDSAGYGSDQEPRGRCRGGNLVNKEIAPWAARKLVLNSLNPYKAVLEAKYSRTSLTEGEFGSRNPCFHQECSIRTHVNGVGSGQGGTATYRHSQSTESKSFNTQKRKAAVRGPSRDDNDDEERDGQRRGPKTPRDSSPPVGRRLACPFFQRHPEEAPKAGSCVQTGFKGVSNLKEHLYRIHENDLLCPRCYQKVDERDFTDHVRACRIVRPDEEHPILDGFDRIQRMKISDKMRGKTTEEKWRAIYKILFPEDPDDTIPSPYWTDQVVLRKEEAMRSLDSYETFIRRELPLRLHRRVHGDAATNVDRYFANAIINVATDALNETISAYWRGEGASLPGRADEGRTHLRATPGPSRISAPITQATSFNDPAPQSPPTTSSNPFVSTPSLQGYDGTTHQRMFGGSMHFSESGHATSASSTQQQRQHAHFPRQQTSTIPVIHSQPCSNSSGFIHPAYNTNSFHAPANRQSRAPASTPEDLLWCFSNESYRS